MSMIEEVAKQAVISPAERSLIREQVDNLRAECEVLLRYCQQDEVPKALVALEEMEGALTMIKRVFGGVMSRSFRKLSAAGDM